MPRPSTARVSVSSLSSSPSPQPTSSTFAPRVTISATSSRSTRALPGAGIGAADAPLLLPRARVLIRSTLCLEAADRAGAVEEAANDREHLRLIEQEGIVTFVGDDLREGNARAGGVERMDDGARIRRREQPVRRERNHAETRRRALEAFGQHAVVIGGKIEIVHRAREIEIGVGVEALDERDALMAQVGFHFEIRIE